jgi:hypothetical protein
MEWPLHCILNVSEGCGVAAETGMKIYLLMLLIASILTAVHFTSGAEKQTETLPQ